MSFLSRLIHAVNLVQAKQNESKYTGVSNNDLQDSKDSFGFGSKDAFGSKDTFGSKSSSGYGMLMGTQHQFTTASLCLTCACLWSLMLTCRLCQPQMTCGFVTVAHPRSSTAKRMLTIAYISISSTACDLSDTCQLLPLYKDRSAAQ